MKIQKEQRRKINYRVKILTLKIKNVFNMKKMKTIKIVKKVMKKKVCKENWLSPFIEWLIMIVNRKIYNKINKL